MTPCFTTDYLPSQSHQGVLLRSQYKTIFKTVTGALFTTNSL